MSKERKAATVSESLRTAIKASGLTSYALGKAAEMSPIAIDRFKNRERGLNSESIDKLCSVLRLRLVNETTRH